MGHSDLGYETLLISNGFNASLPSSTTPNNTVDIDNFTGTPTDLGNALDSTAMFVMTSGSGSVKPFVHSTTSPVCTVTVDGSYSSDPILAQLLTDTARFVRAAGTRTIGVPFQDVDTAFKRVAIGDFVVLHARS